MQIVFWIIVILLVFGISEVACIDCEKLAKNTNSKINTETLVYIYMVVKTTILVILVALAVIGIRIGV